MIFSYSCSKHRLCVHGGSNEYPQSMFWSYKKSGVQGGIHSTGMFWFPDVETNTLIRSDLYIRFRLETMNTVNLYKMHLAHWRCDCSI